MNEKTRSLHVSYRKPLGVNYPKNINSIQRSQEVSINDSLSYSFQKSSSSFLSLENIIFNLTNDNIEQSSELTMKFYDVNYPYSFNLCICRLVYRAFISQRNEETIYFDFLKSLQIKEKANKNHTVFNVFNEYLIKLNSHESFYLIEKMIEQKLIDPAFTIKHHYKDQFYRRFISNNKEISKDDWKLHKELVKEGVNPLKIVNVIRDDDLEKLQEISTQNDFDFNQLIKSSPYERYSFISNKYQNISIIDYCAFFRSVKCFKFLLINGATIRYTLKYAIAGGNLEIIHLCEQNHSKIDNVYEIAIEFHRNDIFHYFYNKKVIEINNLTQLGIKCIEYDNYEILFFLEQEGMEINNKIIQKLGWTGNVFIIRSFQNTKLLNAILPEASYSNNYEIVSFLLEQKGIKVNEKDI